jgi:hypothetical protein
MATSPPHHTFARVTLLPDSGHAKAAVVVDVPPPLGDDDEFFIPRSRFDEAASVSHAVGTRVQVCCPIWLLCVGLLLCVLMLPLGETAPLVVDVPPPLGDGDEFYMPRALSDEAASGRHAIGTRVQVRSPVQLLGVSLLPHVKRT